MPDAYEVAGAIRRSLYDIATYFVASLPVGVKAINSSGMPRGKSDEAPLPVPAGILDIRAEAHQDLHFWAGFIMGTVKDVNGAPLRVYVDAAKPVDLARFIIVWAEQLARLEPDDAANCADDMAKHAGNLMGAALPSPPIGVVIGRCPLVTDTDTCDGTVRATPGEPIRCQRCGTTGALDWWHTLMFGDSELAALVTARDLVGIIANQTGHVIDAATIRKWVERGKVERSGSDEKGRPLYDHVSVIALIRMGKVA